MTSNTPASPRAAPLADATATSHPCSRQHARTAAASGAIAVRAARAAIVASSAIAILALAATAAPLGAQIADRARAVAAVDSIARAAVESGRVAGLTVGVVVGRDTLLLRGYGRADIEAGTPTPDRAIYEIGSVTKQFTAAAIVKLASQGRIDLDADFTRYLPDFDTQGRHITVRRLLNHTSGIRGYTELPFFAMLSSQTLPRDTLLRLVERQPVHFEPGEAMIYNNTGYFLLGLIIENVTGQSYAEYVRDALFAPADMHDSYYCSTDLPRTQHVRGHAALPDGELRTVPYANHTWPYSAGSLCSTAGDLIAWTRALHDGRILDPAAYRSLITPDTLNNGLRTRYAMALSRGTIAGHPAIAHGGAITGFVSHLAYLPEQDATIVVLINTTGGQSPAALATAIASSLFGTLPPPPAVPYTGSLDRYAGTYTGRGRGPDFTVRIEVAEGGLNAFVNNGPNAERAVYVGDGVFRTGNTLLRFVVRNGTAVRAIIDQGASVLMLDRQ
jgi:CubicO group peptidase (beta-lactamase class C family)